MSLKKLTASAATSFLLLGASDVAMAQEVPTFPQLVVFSVQTTSDVVVDPPIAAGGPCEVAVQALRAVPLELQGINVIQESFLTFVLGTPRSGANGAILVCAPEGTAPPTFPALLVSGSQSTPDVVVDPPIAAGDPCVDAVQALRAVPLELQGINVIQESFLTFVLGTPLSGANGTILVCAPEGAAPPAAPAPSAPPPPPAQ